MKEIDSYATTRWGINFLALFGLVFALRYGRVMIIPVIVSLMLTTVLWPAVEYLSRHARMPRVLAGLTVIAGLVLVFALVLLWAAVAIQSILLALPPTNSWLATPPERPSVPVKEVRQLAFYLADGTAPLTADGPVASSFGATLLSSPSTAIPAHVLDDRGGTPPRSPYQMVHDRVAREFNQEIADDLFPPDPEQSLIYRNLRPVLEEQTQMLPSYIRTTGEQLLFILFLVLFLCVEGSMLMRRTAEIFGPSTGPYSRAAIRALEDMATQVRAYLVWRTIINMGMTIALGLIYKYVLGMTFPWVWAVLAGILTYVPYIGPILAFVPTAGDALFSPDGGVWSLIAVTLIYVLILTAEGYIIFPLVIGRNMEMNATTVMLACLFWWLVWGEIGLFLAMPLMGAIKAICQNVPGWEPWANLMGMDKHGSTRRGRLKRSAAWLLAGPLAPLARAFNLQGWVAKVRAPAASSGTDYASNGQEDSGTKPADAPAETQP